jgi:beta-glucosidase
MTVPTGVFPRDFLWGAATAAYQIEGAATEGGRGPSVWDTFSATPGKTRNGDTGAVACDHYHRWRDDIDIAADLGLRAYRMSVSWARLQPSGRGGLNPAGVDFYRQVLTALRDRGIRPFVTLYHWDLPQVLEDAGGWPERDTASRFADYAERTVAHLGDLVEDWIPVNEAWCVSFLGYVRGVHAPGRTDLAAGLRAAHHLNLGHGLAVQAIRAHSPHARIGTAVIVTDVDAASDSDADLAARSRADGSANRLFLDPLLKGSYPRDVVEHFDHTGAFDAVADGDMAVIAAPLDFVGINHYHHHVVAADPDEPLLGVRELPPEPPLTSVGWEIRPQSLLRVLARLRDEYTTLPIYITENGACFDDKVDANGNVDDDQRVDYLDGYLDAVAQAIHRGIDVQGYFAWSLMDNYEWAEGYDKRFGLVYVDYATQQRILKKSARWYRDVIAGAS